jgi:hypothetical protein
MRALLALLALAILAGSVLAQVRVRTEAIRPPASAPSSPNQPDAAGRGGESRSDIGLIIEPARLPTAVAGMRERILRAARSGDPQKLVALMQASDSMPVFSHTQRQDPAAIWKESFPDSDGVEILSILITILETPAARIDAGTPEETYLWPYLASLPLNALTAAQKVDLLRIVTGSDYKDMLGTGRYGFYRVGIAPDGAWRYFVSGG